MVKRQLVGFSILNHIFGLLAQPPFYSTDRSLLPRAGGVPEQRRVRHLTEEAAVAVFAASVDDRGLAALLHEAHTRKYSNWCINARSSVGF